jgi:hypothetical protein
MAKGLHLPTFECLKCGHRWHPREPKEPIRCGFCKTPYWRQGMSGGPSKTMGRHEKDCTCRNSI